jgi:hypothetical protein
MKPPKVTDTDTVPLAWIHYDTLSKNVLGGGDERVVRDGDYTIIYYNHL